MKKTRREQETRRDYSVAIYYYLKGLQQKMSEHQESIYIIFLLPTFVN